MLPLIRELIRCESIGPIQHLIRDLTAERTEGRPWRGGMSDLPTVGLCWAGQFENSVDLGLERGLSDELGQGALGHAQGLLAVRSR
jgi:hypothetical protein